MALEYIASVTGTSSTLAFTSGIDSTYNEYQFHFVNMHPATNEVDFTFQVNAVGASGFNEVITSTFFRAYHGESSGTSLAYDARWDQGQGTGYQPLTYETGSDNDQACSGVLTLYNPSSTTFVKHFVSRSNSSYAGDLSIDNYVAGYINVTAALDEISFKFDSGNIDSGSIHMYGVI